MSCRPQINNRTSKNPDVPVRCSLFENRASKTLKGLIFSWHKIEKELSQKEIWMCHFPSRVEYYLIHKKHKILKELS